MGYMSRRNPLSQDVHSGKIRKINTDQNLINTLNKHFGPYHGARECYLKGLISFEKMREIQNAINSNKILFDKLNPTK